MQDNNPIQVLMHEHEVISSVGDIIRLLDGVREINSEKYKGYVMLLIDFFREYSDRYHHQKEENILFREMINHPDFLLNDIVTELEEHHETFRDYVNRIDNELKLGELSIVQNLLNQYLNDLLDHIAVENDELFVMCESLFTEEEQERIYFLFEDADRESGFEDKEKWIKKLNNVSDELGKHPG